MLKHQINIMGSRGVPANHSGFEYFAAHFSVWAVKQGHEVVVYCQGDKVSNRRDLKRRVDIWNGVTRVHFNTLTSGTLGTMEFDFRCVLDVIFRPGIDLVLGYNTAVFNVLQIFLFRSVYMNMDGIEWKRAKWSFGAKLWFYINELIGGNCFRPIADHPEIKVHLSKRSFRKATVIPYGSPDVREIGQDQLAQFGLISGSYFLVIARPVPENSILEIVRAFEAAKVDGNIKLMILGNYNNDNIYQARVLAAAGKNVIMPGAIFNADVVQQLRYHSMAYIHGHTVGGTNPSLVEALGCGNAIISHDNRFNRWVAGSNQEYFKSTEELIKVIKKFSNLGFNLSARRVAARARHAEDFTLEKVNLAYLNLLNTGRSS